MSEYFVKFLSDEYKKRSRKNSKFSERSFARFLGIDSSLLNHFLNRKRVPSLKIAKKILSRIQVDNPVVEEALLLSLVDPSYELPTIKKRKVKPDDTADWEESAILVLLKPHPAVNRKKDIARNLGIAPEKLQRVLANMELKGMIRQASASVELLSFESHAIQGKYDAKINLIQAKFIQFAVSALKDKQKNKRTHISGTLVTCDPTKLATASKMLHSFRTKVATYIEDPQSDIVYRLNFQLYPITQVEEMDRLTSHFKVPEREV